MEAVVTVAIPASIHAKLLLLARNRNNMPLKKLIAEILQKEIGK